MPILLLWKVGYRKKNKLSEANYQKKAKTFTFTVKKNTCKLLFKGSIGKMTSVGQLDIASE